MSVVISGSAVDRVIVAGPPEVKAGANVMVSAPKSTFAALIASRSVQPSPVPTAVHCPSPGSASELTSNVLKSSLVKVTVALLETVLAFPAGSGAAPAGTVIVTVPVPEGGGVIPETPTL